MNAPAELVPDNSSIVEDRRLRVTAMRLRRLSALAIAAVLNETVETIQADLEWIRLQNADLFGAAPTLDPSQEIGWAIADFEEMESVAWLEFHALKHEAQQRKLSPMFVARARQGWIRTAAMMRVLRIKLLAERGFLQPAASSQTVSQVLRADDIRGLLRLEGLLLEVADASVKRLISEEDESVSPDVEIIDPLESWLDDGGFFVGDE